MDRTSEQHGLKRELRLVDLVLLQVLLVFGIAWAGVAAKEGSTHVLLWLAGIVFFYLPLGAVVILLSKRIPVEGGSYQWVKAGISPFAGYLAAWNTSFYTIVILGAQGPTIVNSVAYLVGPKGDWMMTSTPMLLSAAVLSLLIMFGLNVRGLHWEKWVTAAGSGLTLLLLALMLYLLGRRSLSGIPLAYPPFSLAIPALSVASLNIFTKMSIGALAGFDSAGVFAGECRAPDRDLPLSVWISAPLIGAGYILATASLLAFVPPEKVDLAAPIAQLLQAGFGNAGLGQFFTAGAIVAMLVAWIAQASALMGMTSRFPMVIGWDGLLPTWWSDLHPKFRTPVKALAMVMLACIFVALVSSWGAGGQEIFQIGAGAGTGCLCIMYSTLFAVPLLGKRARDLRPGILTRLAAISGLLVSLLSLPFQIVPLTGVPKPMIFALKVGGLICLINAIGAWLYWRGTKDLAMHQAAQTASIPVSARHGETDDF